MNEWMNESESEWVSKWMKEKEKKEKGREGGIGEGKKWKKKGEYVLGTKERALEKACHFLLKKKEEKNNYERTKEFKQYD